MGWLTAIAIILMLLGWFSLRRGATLHQETGLPTGRLIYADSHNQDWQPVIQPLYSATYGLVGKPDYVVETFKGLIPVEIKSSPAPEIPYLGHLLQLAAYCLLLEETNGQTPPHGYLKYADALFEFDFTSELRHELFDTLADMRQDRLADNVARNHNQPRKCAACGLAGVCDEAL